MTMERMRRLAARCAAAEAAVGKLVDEIEAQRAEALRAGANELRRLLKAAQGARRELALDVEAHPSAFAAPRTATAHGVRFGFRRRASRAAPSAATIDLIKSALPEQRALLVRVKESVNLGALNALSDADLASVGATRTPARDAVVVECGDAEQRGERLLAAAA